MTAASGEAAVNETLARMDEAWRGFSERVQRLATEKLDVRVGDGAWTRKQMLAHVTAWHELTVERLASFVASGEPSGLDDDTDAINARAARSAIGRTTGEVVLALTDSYRHLRREVARLTDAQLAAHDDWAAAIIAGNTFDHYAEHLADLQA